MTQTFEQNGIRYFGNIHDVENAYEEAIEQNCKLSFDEYVVEYCEEYLSTSDLFKKHFGDTYGVGIFHPNIEKFFEELNDLCKREDIHREASENLKNT